MSGLDDRAIWECDVEWVICLAFVTHVHIWEEEVCSGSGVSDSFVCTQCNVDGVRSGRTVVGWDE